MTSETALERRDRGGLFAKRSALSKTQNKILNVFFRTVLAGTFLSMLAVILYYVYAYAALTAGNHGFDWLLGIFSDFVFIMNVSLEESPYLVEDSSYPPLAIAVLYPFALICKGVFARYANQVLTVDELTSRVVLHAEFWVAMILFFVICSAAVILIVTYEYRLTPTESLKLGTIILLCAPFAYAIMRGNTIYFAMIFLLLFLVLRKSRRAVMRELGYVCLALAGLIKIYPLFFGVFLLHEKKLWASVRIGIYTVVGFLLSLFLFGGMDDLLPFVNNLGGFMSNGLRLIAGNNLSLTSLLYKLFYLFSPAVADGNVFGTVNLVLIALVFAVAVVTAVYTRSDFSRFVIASSVVILIPSISYFYVLIFTFLPFMEFLKGYDSMPVLKQRLYTVLFLFIFFTPFIIAKNFIFHAIAVIIMLSVECRSVIKNEMLTAKGTNAAKFEN